MLQFESSTEPVARNLKVLVYGAPKSGKTWFSIHAPAPVPAPVDMAIATEIAHLQEQRDALLSALDKVRAVVDAAKREHPRLRHLVIGNLADQVQALVLLAVDSAYADEWVRRAASAEAHGEHLCAGQKHLIAAAAAAGFAYQVDAERGVHFESAGDLS